uniref:Uncharacterized protein n=1 Tax=Schistocephalus solidus TaxID=70667 RepID=A0A0X3Q2D8_SCHSO
MIDAPLLPPSLSVLIGSNFPLFFLSVHLLQPSVEISLSLIFLNFHRHLTVNNPIELVVGLQKPDSQPLLIVQKRFLCDLALNVHLDSIPSRCPDFCASY